MPEGDAIRAWLYLVRHAVRRHPFTAMPRVNVGVTREVGAALLRSLRRGEATATAVDCRGRSVTRLIVAEGSVVEWLSDERECTDVTAQV